MRLLGTLATVPFVFSVYVAGEHGYLCSDAEGTTNTTYNQALVEKSVTDACLPDSELSAAELAANAEAKKYPQVWVDSEDYGFNETVLLWKYQGNSSESLEELNVLVFTNKSCNILGLLQVSSDQYAICRNNNEQNDKKTSPEILSKKPRPGIFVKKGDRYCADGSTAEKAITIHPEHTSEWGSKHNNYEDSNTDSEFLQNFRRTRKPMLSCLESSVFGEGYGQCSDIVNATPNPESGVWGSHIATLDDHHNYRQRSGGSEHHQSSPQSRSILSYFYSGNSKKKGTRKGSYDLPTYNTPRSDSSGNSNMERYHEVTPDEYKDLEKGAQYAPSYYSG
ncbi:BgTH12-02223 [Blumeria graminis f. sp. triticale]|uniref:BgtE-10127 n=3 Tax=Blumeria graminis TaxID=34373 RepID=A0A061HPX4_BLUGR|nr:putative secreted effector protein [Blumeria graminis f. sp. tritici 96224]CAD6501980.1 BgTH12-02223 [Blumeria graminis f. sp. triticale]VDB85945.1 BgtE-10127 [Blumeria graminis f. sp. tritici]